MKIGMLGAGAYGSAIAGILRDNHHTVKFYDPARFPNATLDSVASWAEVIFIAVPANVVRILLKELPEETFRKPAVILTKGIMDLSVWEQFRYFEIVSGPGFAEDIVKHKRFQLTVAARTATQGETLAEDLLKAPYVKFDKTEDRLGVALLSGLKNIFAIESGRRCLENTSQAYKDYLALAYRECEQILLENGGFIETVRLAAGLGDLALTCGSKKSRNYVFGTLLGGRRRTAERKRLARHYLQETTVEGVFAAKEIARSDIKIPRKAEILTDILKRINRITK
ncbi:hypothetical protein IJG96_00165 [Candidatus Saccharibacteria bacterium]|nr:hypothetical protein [Candidatus Saccharibacteria bacterium]